MINTSANDAIVHEHQVNISCFGRPNHLPLSCHSSGKLMYPITLHVLDIYPSCKFSGDRRIPYTLCKRGLVGSNRSDRTLT